MAKREFDIIIIGAGSGGLSVRLFMNQAGFKVLMISRSDKDIGGDCLNDGCGPSKSLIHTARIIQQPGELIQELILAAANRLSVKAIFNKIYPYPVASRINQGLITELMSEGLSGNVKLLLRIAYKIFN
ncbi:FAD-dependent oxidoreductase [Daejeonella sp.]|uniref:FAD-dependent oxidoreductase n=1 Tax=Daejeonella sp. TaxID=2805397 RepID=UPI0030C01E22